MSFDTEELHFSLSWVNQDTTADPSGSPGLQTWLSHLLEVVSGLRFPSQTFFFLQKFGRGRREYLSPPLAVGSPDEFRVEHRFKTVRLNLPVLHYPNLFLIIPTTTLILWDFVTLENSLLTKVC